MHSTTIIPKTCLKQLPLHNRGLTLLQSIEAGLCFFSFLQNVVFTLEESTSELAHNL